MSAIALCQDDPVRMVRTWLHDHVSVRAEGMILVAGIWALVGLRTVVGSPAALSPGLLHTILPAWAGALLWLVPAAVAVATATARHMSNIGLGLLLVPPLMRCCSYLWSWLMGQPDDWYGAAIYAALVALVVLLSHIPADVLSPLSGRARQ